MITIPILERLILLDASFTVLCYIIDEDIEGNIIQNDASSLCLSSGAKPNLTAGYDMEWSKKTVADADLLFESLFVKTLNVEDACESWVTYSKYRIEGFIVGLERRSNDQLMFHNSCREVHVKQFPALV